MTPKQQRFVEEYLIDLNATQAAIRAGYSADTAEQQGSRLLLMNVDVMTAVRAAKAERSERTKVDADWLLMRLTEEAEADISDLYDEAGALLPVKQWPLIWRRGLVAGIEAVEEKDDRGNVVGMVQKIKLSDRLKRIELIGKHIDVRAFSERLEHTGMNGASLADEIVNAADRIRDKLNRLAE